MNRRRLLRTAAAATPLLPSVWSWLLDATRAMAQAVRSPASGPVIRRGHPRRAGTGSAGRSGGGSSRCARRSPPALEAPSSPRLRAGLQGTEEPLLPRRRGRADADARLGRRLDVAGRAPMPWPPETTDDVVAAVNFARENNLRLVVKGGGHSYQGTSNAADSLLIWTRRMNAVTVHDAFVGAGCAGATRRSRPSRSRRARSGGRSTTRSRPRAGRYVQGGGCMTVGVAGLIQSGGFGSFSKAYGMAAASLLEAEVVTADGAVRIANACTQSGPVLGLKGGGGGSLGVVTRLTLRTHELPEFFGAVFMTIQATSDAAFRRLVGQIIGFYAERAAQSALGRADRLPAGQRPRDRHGVPRARPAAGGGDLAPVPRLAGRLAAGLRHRVRRRWSWPRRPGTSGTRRSSRKLPGLVLADDRPGAPGGQRVLGGQSGRGGAGPARLPVGLASRRRSCRRTSRKRSAMRCSRRPGTGACPCTSTRASPARPPRPSTRPGTRRPIRRCSTPSRWPSAGPRGRRPIPASPATSPTWRPRAAGAQAVGRAMDEMREPAAGRRLLRLGERLLRAAGGSPSGARTTRGCSR